MRPVSFSWVDLRGPTLEGIRFPDDAAHVVLSHWRCALERARRRLATDRSGGARSISALMDHALESAGPRQVRGVISRSDLIEVGGADAADRVIGLLEVASAECGR